MTQDDVPGILREALACHVIFMAFGITPDDMFVVFHTADCCVTCFGKQGSLEYHIRLGDTDFGADELVARWKSTVTGYNSLPADERESIISDTAIWGDRVRIVTGMVMKGFKASEKKQNKGESRD